MVVIWADDSLFALVLIVSHGICAQQVLLVMVSSHVGLRVQVVTSDLLTLEA